MNLPVYQCHKKVGAAKIEDVHFSINGKEARLVLGGSIPNIFVTVNEAWLERNPEVSAGGFYVDYIENVEPYTAYSPADPFEKGYTLLEEVGKPGDEPVNLCSSAPYTPVMDEVNKIYLKMDCLRIAQATLGSGLGGDDKVVSAAEQFYKFAIGASKTGRELSEQQKIEIENILSRFHIGDGVDDCAGYDEEAMAQEAARLIEYIESI